MQQWIKFFVTACLVAVFVDPLFFFLLSAQQVRLLMEALYKILLLFNYFYLPMFRNLSFYRITLSNSTLVQGNKCIVINQPMTKTIVAFRSMTDFIYLLHMLLQVSYSSLCVILFFNLCKNVCELIRVFGCNCLYHSLG